MGKTGSPAIDPEIDTTAQETAAEPSRGTVTSQIDVPDRATNADEAAAVSPADSASTTAPVGRSGPPPGFIRQFELVERVKAYDPHANEDLLNKAYVFALRAHGDQKRRSGDPYFSHPLAVAGILTDLKVDPVTIATALLHDVVEDTDVSIADIEKGFGADVAALVDGVTKISKHELAPEADGTAENFAKFLLATAKDIRVLLVKLADRLHNMRTLDYLRPEKRERIARETMDVYVPMAGRIGVHRFKEELEELSFRHLDPAAYEAIEVGIERFADGTVHDVVAMAQVLRRELQAAEISCEIFSREKRPFSIWSKMQRKGLTLEELADIYAFRVIVSSTDECYRALGVIHQAFTMIPGEFDDYISSPKPNGYQSIHTAVLASHDARHGQRVEIQIRSRDMHDTAERGVAAHWRYKDASLAASTDGSIEIGVSGRYNPYEWLRGVVESLQTADGRGEFLAQAKIDLYQDQVFPFTPKGRVIPLPRGATPMDFAYAVHTEVGNHYSGAKVNGVRRPNRHVLRNGDVVEILTSENAPIPTGWEDFVVTGAAKHGMRRRIRDLKKKEQADLGSRIITSSFAARDLSPTTKALAGAVERLGLNSVEELAEAVGRLDITPTKLVQAAFPNLDAGVIETGQREIRSGGVVPRAAVSIRGMTPGAAVRLAPCCGPLPGERIVGVRDESGAVIAHRIDCDRLAQAQDEEWINLVWSEHQHTNFVAAITMTVTNRTGALGHIGTMLARYGADIVDVRLKFRDPDFTELWFEISVRDVRHLSSVLTGLRASDYVVSAERDEDQDTV